MTLDLTPDASGSPPASVQADAARDEQLARSEERVRASIERARVGAGCVGALFVLGFLHTLVKLVEHPGGWTDLWIGVVGAGMLYFAITGDTRWLPFFDSEEPETTSPRFRELADPTRPLPPETVRDAATSEREPK